MPTPNNHSPPSTGTLLQAFSTAVKNGLILLIGDVAWEYQKDTISAMDYSTRLVINLYPDSAHADSSEQLESDLRVAVHCQNPEEFLSDVSRHELNMVVTDDTISEPLAKQIESMLAEGGFWIILDVDRDLEVNTSAFYSLNIGSCVLLVKKTDLQIRPRRGGRRARLAGDSYLAE